VVKKKAWHAVGVYFRQGRRDAKRSFVDGRAQREFGHEEGIRGREAALPGLLLSEDIFLLDLIPTAFARKEGHIRLRLGVIVSTGNPLAVDFLFEKAELDAGVKPGATTHPSQSVL
jgi:hypothetical protein